MSIPNSSSDLPQRGHHEVVLELAQVGVRYGKGRGVLPWRHGEFWALEDVSLRVYSGETLGVIGRNGAGKSTMLRLLAGIIQPDRGSIMNYGVTPTLLSLQVGFVQHLSGRENAIMSGLLLGLSLHEIEALMDDIIAFAELEEFIDEPIQTYSSGMRARLGFATAFHVDSDVLLIDEVLGVGDAAFKEKSKAVMRERIRSNKTAIMVSHSAGAVRSLCDRLVWIDRGRVRMEGDCEDVLHQYLSSTRTG